VPGLRRTAHEPPPRGHRAGAADRQARAELAQSEAENRDLIKRIAHLEEELERTRVALARVRAERDALKVEAEDAREQIAEMQRRVAELTGEIERLRAQLDAHNVPAGVSASE